MEQENSFTKKVGIIMGSDSDLPVMEAAVDVLRDFGVSYEVNIVSAHRTPDRMFEYAKEAPQNNIGIIIAGAGGSAHLPGMVAALTHLPVIGVPVKSKALMGMDSLLSIVQMPKGVPVATVAIDGAANAALLAIQILAINSPELTEKVKEYRDAIREEVVRKDGLLVEGILADS